MASLSDKFKNVSVERALLSAVLIDFSTIDKVRGKVKPEDFSSQVLGTHYKHMLEYANRHGAEIPLDYSLLVSEANGEISLQSLVEIASSDCNLSLVDEYAREIRRNALRRKAVTKLSEIATMLANGADIKEVVKIINTLAEMDRGESRTVKSAQEAVADAYMLLYSRIVAGQDFGTYFNLFPSLRNKIMLNPGDVCVLAARPGDGKSAFSICQGLWWAKAGKKVLYISLEMSLFQIALRIAAHLTEFSTSDYLLRKDETIVSRLVDVSASVPKTFEMVDAVNNIDDIARIVKERKPDIVILDYLGLVEVGGVDDIYQRVSKASRQIKKLALQEQVIVFAAHQVNRQVASRGGTELYLHDLRDSGAVEQDADAIFFLYPQAEETTPKPAERKMYLKLEKNRNGETAKVSVVFNMPKMSIFEEAKL